MRKILSSVILLAFSVIALHAQTYQVYTVKGDVTFKDGDKVAKVEPGNALDASTIIVVPAQARLVVLCETSKDLFTIKTEATDALANLVKKQGNSSQHLTESYLAFIRQKITDSGNPKDKNYKQSAGTSYREADSLLLKTLVPDEQADSTVKDKNAIKKTDK